MARDREHQQSNPNGFYLERRTHVDVALHTQLMGLDKSRTGVHSLEKSFFALSCLCQRPKIQRRHYFWTTLDTFLVLFGMMMTIKGKAEHSLSAPDHYRRPNQAQDNGQRLQCSISLQATHGARTGRNRSPVSVWGGEVWAHANDHALWRAHTYTDTQYRTGVGGRDSSSAALLKMIAGSVRHGCILNHLHPANVSSHLSPPPPVWAVMGPQRLPSTALHAHITLMASTKPQHTRRADLSNRGAWLRANVQLTGK